MQWALINLALSVAPALTLLVGGLPIQADTPITIGTLVAMERLWGTLQKRLPPLLRQAGVGADVEASNRWLSSVYVAQHNERFGVEAAEDGSAFVPFAGPLDDILCIEEERVVGHDNTVRYAGRVLRTPQACHRHHFVKAKVKVHEYADGSLAPFHGPRRIADYDGRGACCKAMRTNRNARRNSAPRRDLWTARTAWTSEIARPLRPQGQQKQKRKLDLLPKPDVSRSYRQNSPELWQGTPRP